MCEWDESSNYICDYEDIHRYNRSHSKKTYHYIYNDHTNIANCI